MRNKLKTVVQGVRGLVNKRGFKFFFPMLYFFILAFSLLLALAYVPFPSLTICANLFGEQFCTPIGIYLASVINLPGYFIAGNLLNIAAEVKWYFSLTYVILSSALFYYLLGLLVDKFRDRKTPKTSLIIITVFTILLFLLIALARQPASVP